MDMTAIVIQQINNQQLLLTDVSCLMSLESGL